MTPSPPNIFFTSRLFENHLLMNQPILAMKKIFMAFLKFHNSCLGWFQPSCFSYQILKKFYQYKMYPSRDQETLWGKIPLVAKAINVFSGLYLQVFEYRSILKITCRHGYCEIHNAHAFFTFKSKVLLLSRQLTILVGTICFKNSPLFSDI